MRVERERRRRRWFGLWGGLAFGLVAGIVAAIWWFREEDQLLDAPLRPVVPPPAPRPVVASAAAGEAIVLKQPAAVVAEVAEAVDDAIVLPPAPEPVTAPAAIPRTLVGEDGALGMSDEGQVAAVEGECPESHPIKGNHSRSGEFIYHQPGGRNYERTRAEVCFTTPAVAEAAGFRAPKH